jgi:hypothetical protein
MGQNKTRLAWWIAVVGVGVGSGWGDEAPGRGEIGLVLEPLFAAGEIRHEVEGAKETVLVPARSTSAGADTFTEAEWAAEGLAWPEVMEGAMRVADRVAGGMEVRWSRDANGVIVYGTVRAPDPFLGSALFSRKFLDRFRAELGPEVFVVMPDREGFYVFPRFGGKLEEYGAALAGKYRDSALKVSLEVFLVDGRGCRVVGTLGGGAGSQF